MDDNQKSFDACSLSTGTSTGWNAELISRYDLSGPRYTSYPTAPQFTSTFSNADLHAAIERSNNRQSPLSLYFHLPFCDTLCYYCGCNKVVTQNKGRAKDYLSALDREMALLAPLFNASRPVNQLHWGGGTPTFLNEEEMKWLVATIRKHFRWSNDDTGEYSIEVHPGRVKPDVMRTLRKLGFNRVSMGVQDFDPDVQKAVNRFNSEEDVSALVRVLREEAFHSISMDLIYGLPLQTQASVQKTLDKVIALAPDRLSLFNYAHMPQIFKSQRLIQEEDLPSAAEKLDILHFSIERLQNEGYVHIGMDHFAKPNDSLVVAQKEGKLQRNFQGYGTHGDCELIGFGVSSISAFGDVYVQNAKNIKDYQSKTKNKELPYVQGFVLSDDDKLRKAVIDQIICHFSLNFSDIEKAFDIHFQSYFTDEISSLLPLQRDGLIDLDLQGLKVLDAGRLLVRRVCMVFDAYLKDSQPDRYSKII